MSNSAPNSAPSSPNQTSNTPLERVPSSNNELETISLNGTDWKLEEEMILKSWSEKASCFKVMHDRSFKRFWCLNAWFAVPVIIISTLTGTGNFAQNSFPDEYKAIAPYIIGALNIIAGIISTIAQFLVVAQRMEGHRMSSINWDKFSRKIKTELSKKKLDRQTITEFLPNCQEQYDRLLENSPNLPAETIRWFKRLVREGGDTMKGCQLCCFECFCFPFGFECCRSKCCYRDQENEEKEQIIRNLREMDLPEIIGHLKAVEISDSEWTKDANEIPNPYQIYNTDA